VLGAMNKGMVCLVCASEKGVRIKFQSGVMGRKIGLEYRNKRSGGWGCHAGGECSCATGGLLWSK
jgi:hypothetical protein